MILIYFKINVDLMILYIFYTQYNNNSPKNAIPHNPVKAIKPTLTRWEHDIETITIRTNFS